MEIEELFGLPAHPIVVHGAVVLIPLVALGVVLVVASPRLRARLGVTVAVLAVVALGFAVLAEQTGEGLEERVDETALVEEHAELGETMPLIALALAASAVGVAALDIVARRSAGGPVDAEAGADTTAGATRSWVRPAAVAVSALAVLSAVGATVQVVRVGHTGAEATWDDVAGEGGEHGGDDGDDHDEDDEGAAPAPATPGATSPAPEPVAG